MPNKENLKPFKAGNEWKGNDKGRPCKMVSQTLKDLKERGIERVRAFDIVEMIETFINLPVEELKDIANNEKESWLSRQTAKNMLKSGEKAWNELQDRAHGKAIQKTENENKTHQIITFEVTEKTKNNLEKLISSINET
jgi:hypothetical protein